MKELIKNKKVLLTVLVAFMLGGTIGWLAKPSPSPSETEEAVHVHDEDSDQIWTCSMHPQIRLSEPGSCPICGMDLIPASSKRSAASASPLMHEMTPEAVAMANVHTSLVTGVSPEGELFLTGKVKADERQLASVTAKFPGRIDQLFVNFTGQVVRQGERLATIYSPELVTAQKELLEAASTKSTYPELYQAAREKLRLWKLNEKQIDDLEGSGKVQDQFDVLADKSGIVTQRNISVGDYVNTGSVLFDIVDLNRVWIMIDAYESDLPFVKIGDEVNFTAAGIPGETFKAKITYIDPVINSSTRAASVRAEASNSNGELRPEMFINARVRTTLRKGQSSLAITRTALLWSGKRSIVYVKVPDTEFPTYEMREITIGPRMGEMWLVEAGLEAGEEIVTNGVFAIDAAAQLSGNYSMLMRPDVKTMDVPQAFREQITALADAYFKVKNGLVADDPKATQSALEQLEAALDQIDMAGLKGQAHDHWMALKQKFSEATKMMQDEENLDGLRQHFSMLSENMLEVTESFGLQKDKVYKDFCPMAFDNKGAFWLSESEEILNPYFGEAMLSCGEVKETYLKGQKVFEDGGPAKQAASGHNH
ncbi:efflux RND transporter periplasmic adaptor subunit [Reichenbachiella sp. MALMAid0571]|uniref:efflux RND transporter periplasmic adaptor subunit n=1 Tax=Reichenbachiella sp. MALMAid0571 TaxID=3143939 RepID=UPI0032DEF104